MQSLIPYSASDHCLHRGKFHAATVTGAMIIVSIQLLQWPIAGTAAFESLTYWLAGLAAYSIIPPT